MRTTMRDNPHNRRHGRNDDGNRTGPMRNRRIAVVFAAFACIILFGTAAGDESLAAAQEPAVPAPAATERATNDDAEPAALRGFERMLAEVGMTMDDVSLPMEVMPLIGQDEHKLPLFDYLARRPFLLDVQTRDDAAALATAVDEPDRLLGFAGRRLGIRAHRGVSWAATLAPQIAAAKRPGAMIEAVAELHAMAGEPLGGGEIERLRAHAAEIPAAVAEAVALILFAAKQAIEWRRLAVAELELLGCDLDALFRDLVFVSRHSDPHVRGAGVGANVEANAPPSADPTGPIGANARFARLRTWMNRLDLTYLSCAAQDLAKAVRLAEQIMRDANISDLPADALSTLSFRATTPFGAVVVNGTGDDHYLGRTPYLLIFDLGGNDRYFGGGATISAQNPVSVIFDWAGDDRYEAVGELPAFGAGVLGVGILADFAGSDTYSVQGPGLGMAHGGVGMLVDYGPGADSFDGDTFCQAAAAFGIGILVNAPTPGLAPANGDAKDADGAGEEEARGPYDDRYHAYRQSQAFASTRGFAALIDMAGNDRYIANNTHIKYPSPQSAQHNANMCQGAASGRRADATDGHSRAGGYAILVDWAGDDHYSGGVFVQGVGYWYGIGLLFDRDGNDRYEAAWYGQGASAHFALAAFVDANGNDHYTTSISQGMGNGRDYSIATFTDDAGDDTYIAADRSLGSGDIFGIGIFWDKAGSDDYRGVKGRARNFGDGWAEFQPGGTTPHLRTIGLFLDSGGADDHYPALRADRLGNGRLWRHPVHFPNARFGREISLGLDE